MLFLLSNFPGRLRALACLALLAFSLLSSPPEARAASPAAVLPLDGRGSVLSLWPVWRLLPDPTHQLRIEQVLALDAGQFVAPTGPQGNLGIRPDTVWLRASLVIPAGGPSDWWLSIDFFPLDEVEVFVVAQGRVVQRAYLSQLLAFKDKASPTHQHAVRLALQAGQEAELVMRIRKYAPLAMLMPASVMRTDALIAREASFQFWQSLMLAVGLGLAGYALVSAVLNRERLYLWFAVFAASHAMSWFAYFGLASQHFWPERGGLNSNVSLFFALLQPLSGLLFVDRALDLRQSHPWISQCMRGLSAVLAVLALVFALGLVDESVVGLVVGLVGPWPFFLILPLALPRAFKGDRMALWTIAGWVPHAMVLAIGVGLHRGLLPWSEWDNLVPQLGVVLDLLAWTMVMSLHSKRQRRDAAQHRLERDKLLVDVQTDGLTGLLNRRGLQEGLRGMLAQSRPGHLLALYVIDLDGFKPVNDLHGHDAGDEALVQVAQRLRQSVRAGDLICRIGGDEFVVAAGGLVNEAQAQVVGDKLLACAAQPFDLGKARCTLGMTIGYALSPNDSTLAEALLKLADAAMYRGKQSGKQQVLRAG